MKQQIQSLLAKLQNAANASEETSVLIRTAPPVAIRYTGSLQECLPVQEITTMSINILTDLRIGPPPMTTEAY